MWPVDEVPAATGAPGMHGSMATVDRCEGRCHDQHVVLVAVLLTCTLPATPCVGAPLL